MYDTGASPDPSTQRMEIQSNIPWSGMQPMRSLHERLGIDKTDDLNLVQKYRLKPRGSSQVLNPTEYLPAYLVQVDILRLSGQSSDVVPGWGI